MNMKPLSVGDSIKTMHVGHSVDAIITGIVEELVGSTFTRKFTVAYQGQPLWLDYGQGWKIAPGEKFTTTQDAIDRAAYWADKLAKNN